MGIKPTYYSPLKRIRPCKFINSLIQQNGYKTNINCIRH